MSASWWFCYDKVNRCSFVRYGTEARVRAAVLCNCKQYYPSQHRPECRYVRDDRSIHIRPVLLHAAEDWQLVACADPSCLCTDDRSPEAFCAAVADFVEQVARFDIAQRTQQMETIRAAAALVCYVAK